MKRLVLVSLLFGWAAVFGGPWAYALNGDRDLALTVNQPDSVPSVANEPSNAILQLVGPIEYTDEVEDGRILSRRAQKIADVERITPIEGSAYSGAVTAQNASRVVVVEAGYADDQFVGLQLAAYQPSRAQRIQPAVDAGPGSLARFNRLPAALPDERQIQDQFDAAIAGYHVPPNSSADTETRFEGVFDQRISFQRTEAVGHSWKQELARYAGEQAATAVPAADVLEAKYKSDDATTSFASGAYLQQAADDLPAPQDKGVLDPDRELEQASKQHLRRDKMPLVEGGDFADGPGQQGPVSMAVLTGTVFVDFNNDGVRQANEPGLAGAEISTRGGANAFRADQNGFFASSALRDATYEFAVNEDSLPLGYVASPLGARDITLTKGKATNIDVPVAVSGQVRGGLFIDLDNDGQFGARDQVLEGQSIRLINRASNEVTTVTSASFGQFGFDNVRPGKYVVRVHLGWQEYSVDTEIEPGQSIKRLAIAVPPEVAGVEPIADPLPRLIMADISTTKKPGSDCCRAPSGQEDHLTIRRLP